MIKTEQDTYRAIIERITGGQRTSSVEEIISYEEMKKFNEGMTQDRLDGRRKAAASQRKAAQIILNA